MNRDMLDYIVRRLAQIPVVLFLVSLIIFFIIHLPEGGPARTLLGVGAPESMIEAFREQYHLDKPLHEQYLIWIKGVLSGSLGTSIYTGQPVGEMILNRLPVTFALATFSITIAISIALPAGYISAVEHYSWKDHLATTLAFLGLSIPNFFLAILLMKIFGVELGLLPISGGTTLFQDPFHTFKVFVLPAIALGTALAAQTTRMLRSSMLEIFSEDYVMVARARGLPATFVNRYVVFKNALIPVITIVALQFGFLLGGTVIIEHVFALPGLGQLMLNSVNNRDYPVMQVLVLFFAVSFILINLIADIMYTYVDPRIRYGGGD